MSCRVLLADPPWQYNDRRETRRDNPGRKSTFGIGVARRYHKMMDTRDLAALGPAIRQATLPDAYCFMWVTSIHLATGLQTMADWGFTYKNIAFFWSKLNCRSLTEFKGPGRYVPSNVELVLFGVRGKPWHPRSGSKPAQEIRCPQERHAGKIVHSRKPEALQERIEAWLSPHIGVGEMWELFATRQRPGWLCLGHSLTATEITDDLADLAEN
jgi:N6-adenosine-specific RNA methylase IME4